jgi:hypothetical protein
MFYSRGPWGFYYKPFYGHIIAVLCIARLFATAIDFHPSLIFDGLNPTKVEPLMELYSNGQLLALITYIMAVANTLAYYDLATITAVKCFTVEAPEAFTINIFKAILLQYRV